LTFDNEMGDILPFSSFQSSIEPSFWSALTELKIDVLKLSDAAVDATGSYRPGQTITSRETGEQFGLGCLATFEGGSLRGATGHGVPLRGSLRNFNTIEDFRKLDKQAHFDSAVAQVGSAREASVGLICLRKLWQRFLSEDLPVQDLNPFFVIAFADLKKYKYYYWFCFPAFVANPPWKLVQPFQPLQEVLSAEGVGPRSLMSSN
jgi:ubiquitin-like modifier-activating enzyme ATG7